MPTTRIIRNIITASSLVVLVILLGVYLWGPKIFQTVTPLDAPIINFATDVVSLSGTVTKVSVDGFVMTMPSSGFPAEFDVSLLSRNVVIDENTVVTIRQRRNDVDVYAEEMVRYQEFLARHSEASLAAQASSTVVTARTTDQPSVPQSHFLQATSTEILLKQAPQLYTFATTSRDTIVSGTTISIRADENIYVLPDIVATEILILEQN